MQKIILTIMCYIYKEDGSFLVMNRRKNDWPGLTFPGGHVEENEYIEEACKREIKEETNLDIFSPICVGHIEWLEVDKNCRHLAILYQVNKFKGELKSSREGEIFFIKEEDIKNYKLSNDFYKIYNLLKVKN